MRGGAQIFEAAREIKQSDRNAQKHLSRMIENFIRELELK